MIAEVFEPAAVVVQLTAHDRLSAANGQHIFIQYSGYGYAKRGAPLWLVEEVRRLKAEGCIVGVHFHEIYASGSPWRSSFWLSPAQKYVAKMLASIADYWMTNRQNSADWLRRYGHAKPNIVLPTFSNVGESSFYVEQRQRKVIVFGGAVLRAKTYLRAGAELFHWARSHGLLIHDIGPPMPDPKINAALQRNGVFRHGVLTSSSVREVMADAKFGVVAYPADYIAKSGVFASYCAHGLCPIVMAEVIDAAADGLAVNDQFLARLPAGEAFDVSGSIAYRAWHWYQSHRIGAHAVAVADLHRRAKVKC
ncbi:hypothetical protein [Thermomonas sp. HDW16]|uniref:hypothetical protein n=1 Tax=Thermomonas sp. HDW16 TaxID=2714945 RepID=UPI001407AABF|nr:hypothetical protein [Thermomonas sp. HDW16]QIL20508.1 hypothetical protein G7079_07060 [Thermomonas sp. HDW16]